MRTASSVRSLTRGGFRPTSAVRSSAGARDRGADRRSRSSCSRPLRSRRSGGSTSYGSSRSRSESTPISSSDATPMSSESSKGSSPSTRCAKASCDSSWSRCTVRAGRRRLWTCIRLPAPASSTSSGSSRARAPPAPGRDSPPRGGDRRVRPQRRQRTRTAKSSSAILAGRVVPVIGLDGAGDLAARLATRSECRTTGPSTSPRLSQYVATMQRLRAALRRAPQPLRGGRRAEPAASLPREAPRPAPRARRAASAHRHDELRPRARACIRGGGRGARHRRVRGDRAASRPLLAPTARRAAATDRRPEHVRDRALARASHDPAQAPRRGRSAARARVGELRHHRGRLHRLPRPLGARPRSSRSRLPQSCVGATSSSSATRWPTGTSRSILNRIWGDRPVAYRSWAVQRAPSALAQAFWRRYDVTAVDVDPDDATSSCSSGGWRRHEQRTPTSPYKGLNAVRGHRARRAPLLRTRARDRDRRGEPHRLSAHRPLRAERRREVVVAARRSRALAPGAAGGAARGRLLELERRSDSRPLRGGGRGVRALDERLRGDCARAGAVDA